MTTTYNHFPLSQGIGCRNVHSKFDWRYIFSQLPYASTVCPHTSLCDICVNNWLALYRTNASSSLCPITFKWIFNDNLCLTVLYICRATHSNATLFTFASFEMTLKDNDKCCGWISIWAGEIKEEKLFIWHSANKHWGKWTRTKWMDSHT